MAKSLAYYGVILVAVCFILPPPLPPCLTSTTIMSRRQQQQGYAEDKDSTFEGEWSTTGSQNGSGGGEGLPPTRSSNSLPADRSSPPGTTARANHTRMAAPPPPAPRNSRSTHMNISSNRSRDQDPNHATRLHHQHPHGVAALGPSTSNLSSSGGNQNTTALAMQQQQAMVSIESPLPPVVQRSLGDRSNEKRKNAALEIEALVKSLQVSAYSCCSLIVSSLSTGLCGTSWVDIPGQPISRKYLSFYRNTKHTHRKPTIWA